MKYKIQILEPESGFYLNTNHESDELDSLKQKLATEACFVGFKFQW